MCVFVLQLNNVAHTRKFCWNSTFPNLEWPLCRPKREISQTLQYCNFVHIVFNSEFPIIVCWSNKPKRLCAKGAHNATSNKITCFFHVHFLSTRLSFLSDSISIRLIPYFIFSNLSVSHSHGNERSCKVFCCHPYSMRCSTHDHAIKHTPYTYKISTELIWSDTDFKAHTSYLSLT